MKCQLCGRSKGHKKDCLMYGVKDTEPHVTIPESIKKENKYFNPVSRYEFYMPTPNTTDEGYYITRSGLVELLRTNKHNPEAIAYIADMLE